MHSKDEKIQKLLHYISHPAQFSPGSTWTVPFCFKGNEVNELTQLLKKPNVNTGSNETFYGYKFCESIEHQVTDVGLCTTFHDVQNMFPPKGMSKPYQKGINLILDSFAYFGTSQEIRSYRDYQSKVFLFNTFAVSIEKTFNNNCFRAQSLISQKL